MKVRIDGFPEGTTDLQAEERFRDASARAVSDAIRRCRVNGAPTEIAIAFRSKSPQSGNDLGSPTSSRAQRAPLGGSLTDETDFSRLLSTPRANADSLCLDPTTMERIQHALDRVRVKSLVYEQWGLKQVDPYPRTTLSFSGSPGTGKTLAAHYIARQLGKKIIAVTYADAVSKYFGQSARNLTALYQFALKEDAIVFIDEAESLLSTRIDVISDGADHAINTMRSQLLSVMETTPIFSIVASNLAASYDKAFESRLLTIHFSLPDQHLRERIWRSHLPDSLPIAEEVTPEHLAARFPNLNGRQIARAIIEAAHRAAIQGQPKVVMLDFDWAIKMVMETCK
jgi:ATP-dependent 26S proteasome regulatory subunit